MISLLGDAELDEGNIYEAVLEGGKHDLRNTWWIVDYNRQSLDATTSDRMAGRFEGIFTACGWDIITLKYGRKLERAFAERGGDRLKTWIDACPNDLYAALTFQGGAAWRKRLQTDIGDVPGVNELLGRHDDEALGALMTNLGGHDLELLLETFKNVDDDRPKLFVAYTIKGIGLPLQGHKDNHSGFLTEAQMEVLRAQMGISKGHEWDCFEGLPRSPENYENFLAQTTLADPATRRFNGRRVDIPSRNEFPHPTGRQSTQVAFGKILNDIARKGGPLADAIVTTSPDVTVSTNLGGWVNQRGLFARGVKADMFKEAAIASPQRWAMSPAGQHIELGIAENNLFLLLAAAGLSDSLFGHRLIPIGTVYDPFINRGLDALNYACYQDARFMLVATPAGITLGPEGGAHQSIHTPQIGMAQDKLTYFEPAFVDELVEIMRWGFDHLQQPTGNSIYLRLSTRSLDQPSRELEENDIKNVISGAYWRVPPGEAAEIIVIYCGAIAPEASAAFEQIREDDPDAGLLAITSPDRLHRDWSSALRSRARGDHMTSHIEQIMAAIARSAALVTVMDGPPGTLSWLGGVCGHRLVPLGVDRFGQSGDLIDLYDEYRLGSIAVIEVAATAILERPGVS